MTVNVNGNVERADIDDLAEKIKEKLMDELRMRGVF
jgi:translation elongation factor EF-1beta